MRSVCLAVRRVLLIASSVFLYAAWTRWSCAVMGHKDALIFRENGEIYLRCDRCGCRSKGWDLTQQKVVQR